MRLLFDIIKVYVFAYLCITTLKKGSKVRSEGMVPSCINVCKHLFVLRHLLQDISLALSAILLKLLLYKIIGIWA